MMHEKHSSVCYIFREGAFSPVKEGKLFRNDFGLDLFQYKGAIYEGRTGLHNTQVGRRWFYAKKRRRVSEIHRG